MKFTATAFAAMFMIAAPSLASAQAAAKSPAFEIFGRTDKVFSFYRTESKVSTRFIYLPSDSGFEIKTDSSISPGSTVKFPPSTVFNYDRTTAARTLVWTSKTCWPTKRTDSGNDYIKSVKCDAQKQKCDIEFDDNFGNGKQKDVSYSLQENGSIEISARNFALALTGKVPNKTDEFKDLTSGNLRYGRIAVSSLVCSPQDTHYAECHWSMERDQNPYPLGRPWDDCDNSF